MPNVRNAMLLLVALCTPSPVSETGAAHDPVLLSELRQGLPPDVMSLRGSAASPPADLVRLEPPYEVEDGLTIVGPAGRVRIAGLDGPARNAVCLDREDKMWACGLQARAALANLIRGQAVTCSRTLPGQGENLPATCSVAGRDIASALVRDGFARPAGSPGRLGPSLDRARAETRGLWDGGWSIRDGSWSIRP